MVDLPRGWMFCNGSDITEGPWKGGKTPDLNSIGAFLRGGSEDLVLEVEDSQIEDHTHKDPGHSHACSATSVSDPHNHDTNLKVRVYIYKDGNNHDAAGLHGDTRYTDDTTVKVTTTCSVASETSGLGGVSSPANSGSETRPINMKVIYIIRVN